MATATQTIVCNCNVTDDGRSIRCDFHAEQDFEALRMKLRMGTTTESRDWLDEEAEFKGLIIKPRTEAREGEVHPLFREGFRRMGERGRKSPLDRQADKPEMTQGEHAMTIKVNSYKGVLSDPKVKEVRYSCEDHGTIPADHVPVCLADDAGVMQRYCPHKGCVHQVYLVPTVVDVTVDVTE